MNTEYEDHFAFTLEQFGRRYGLSRSSVLRQIEQGHLKSAKIGCKHLIPKAEGERWLQERLEASNPQRAA